MFQSIITIITVSLHKIKKARRSTFADRHQGRSHLGGGGGGGGRSLGSGGGTTGSNIRGLKNLQGSANAPCGSGG